MSQVLLSPRAYDNELMSELTEQAVLECDVSDLAITSCYYITTFGELCSKIGEIYVWLSITSPMST